MWTRLRAAFAIGLLAVTGVEAAERDVIGAGYLFVNDSFVGGHDRWRTGSAVGSIAFGPRWDGAAPSAFGELLELRAGGEIMSPLSLTRHRDWDRRYATSVSVGLHTHIQRGAVEASIGGAVVAIGSKTNLDEVQSFFHQQMNVRVPSKDVLDHQIGNKWRLRGVAEVGRTLNVGGNAELRPFAEVRVGDENLARVGFDFTLGNFGRGALLARDSVTGHRYGVVANQEPGWSFVVGADAAKVFSSVYLPEVGGLELTDARLRARAGLHWQGERAHVFYGVSWLGEEFEMQPESQVVGALSVTYRF